MEEKYKISETNTSKLDLDEIIFDRKFLAELDIFPKKFPNDKIHKLRNAAIKHGYRGPSNGKRNGIVPIRPSDIQLLEDYKRSISNLAPDLQSMLKDAKPVKVVAHVPSGNRLIGALYENEEGNRSVYIVSISNYRKRIR